MAKNLSPYRILQLGFGFWATRTLLTAIEIGLGAVRGGGHA